MHPGEPDGASGPGPSAGIWRAVDASANRASEALRVIEDVVRFTLDDVVLTALAKDLRHGLAAVLARPELADRGAARDVAGDVGQGLDAAASLPRTGIADLVVFVDIVFPAVSAIVVADVRDQLVFDSTRITIVGA